MTVQAVFFDLDGTLVDSLPSIAATFQEIRKKMGLDFPLEYPLSLVGIPLIDIATKTVGEARSKEFLENYSAYYVHCCKNSLKLFPGIAELLQFLYSRRIKMAVITSKRIKSTSANLELLKIDHYFTAVITPDLVSLPKPDPEPVLLALEKTKTPPEEALMVGDTFYDIAAGKKANVRTIAVTWGNYDEEKLFSAKPDFAVDTVADLKKKITTLL